uniref:Uncharacterized protein n=1 Tax=Arundo donax TaxID=35708 RepID=A0A0A9C4N7_ARUDO
MKMRISKKIMKAWITTTI